jgi:hypothetical protein
MKVDLSDFFFFLCKQNILLDENPAVRLQRRQQQHSSELFANLISSDIKTEDITANEDQYSFLFNSY